MEHFELTEIQPFSEKIYFIDENYIGKYAIKSKIANKATISFISVFSQEFIVSDISSPLLSGEERQISISFYPNSPGKKIFELSVSSPKAKKKSLEKIFNVEAKLINIEGKIEKQLPTSMKLGQKAEIIFLYTNKGNQTATNISIDIQQIEII